MELFDRLDVGRLPICLACLSFVAIPLGDGDEREAKRWARRMTPDIWHEGLAGPALAAMHAAVAEGVEGAAAALADLEANGGRSKTARELVLYLAADADRRMKKALAAHLN